jgi:hypothetical protein
MQVSRRETRPAVAGPGDWFTGDVVWTPPGVKHWHGATDGEAMTHSAIQSVVDGEVVEWLEHVTDEQYG